jgi:hypothetical protein
MLREELPLQQFLLLPIARQEVEELHLKRRARLGVVEGLQERVLFPLLEQRRGLQLFGQPFDQRRLADADRSLDRDVVEAQQRLAKSILRHASARAVDRRPLSPNTE